MTNTHAEALKYFEVLLAAYRYDGPTPKWPAWANPLESENSDTDTQYVYEYMPADSLLYILFPGTASLRDVITDAMAWKQVVPYGNFDSAIRVHAGFSRAWKSIRGLILAIVVKHRPENIVVVGHSLGGGIAPHCAVDIQYNTGIVPRVYTSGAPRTGNKAFRDSYNRRIPTHTRYENYHDPVVMVPRINYYHVGELCKIRAKDKSVKVKFVFGKFFISLILLYHNILNYIKGIKPKCGRNTI